METSKFVRFNLHITTLINYFSLAQTSDIVQVVEDIIGTVNTAEYDIIRRAVLKWMRAELYGTHGRRHHALAYIDEKSPVELLRHVGDMIARGYMKYVPLEIATVLERHNFYSERFLVFTFLEWVHKQNVRSKVKFNLPAVPGRTGIRDSYRAGVILTSTD